MLGLILLLVLLVLLVAALPLYPYSREWNFIPCGGLGVVMAIVLVLQILGQVR